MRPFLLIIYIILLSLPVYALEGSESKRLEALPKFIYAHVGVSGNFFILNSDDINGIVDPFKLSAVNFGYAYYFCSGIRNIAQFEYRKGKDNNGIFFDRGFTDDFKIDRTSVNLKFDHTQWLVKLNPVFFVKELRGWSLFVVWGKGDVDFLDEAKDGFEDGDKTVAGVEVSIITKYAQFGGSLEKHSMTFKRFSIEEIGSAARNFDASYLQFNLRLAFGLGF